MADAGHIVTDEEVIQVVPGIKSIGPKETILIQGIEGLIERYCQTYFGLTTYTDEPLTLEIPSAALLYGAPPPPVRALRLRHAPVITLTSLANVTGRESDGSYTRSAINVWECGLDRRAGWIYVPYALVQFSNYGYGGLLASYRAGYGPSDPVTSFDIAMPPDLKLAVINEISRYWKLHEGEIMHVQSLNTELGSTSYLRQGLTPETKLALEPYRRILVA